MTGPEAARRRQEAYKEVTIARHAQGVLSGDVFVPVKLRADPEGSRRMAGATRAMKTQVIAANEYRRERWKNGTGWTREIVRVPDDADWDWRLSIAEIEQDGPFSVFEGIERELVLIHGNGLRLRLGGDEVHELHPPHGRLRFAGERVVQGELLDGTTHDFNLMWRRDAVAAELIHRPLVGPMVFFTEPGCTWAIHLLAGQARFDEASGLPSMWAGDTALLVDAGSRNRYVLDGGGEVLVIKVSAAAQ